MIIDCQFMDSEKYEQFVNFSFDITFCKIFNIYWKNMQKNRGFSKWKSPCFYELSIAKFTAICFVNIFKIGVVRSVNAGMKRNERCIICFGICSLGICTD